MKRKSKDDDFIVDDDSESVNLDSDTETDSDYSSIKYNEIFSQNEIIKKIDKKMGLPNKIIKISDRINNTNSNNIDKSLKNINNNLDNLKKFLSIKHVGLSDILALKINNEQKIDLLKQLYILNSSESPDIFLQNYLTLNEKFNSNLISGMINFENPNRYFMDKLQKSSIPINFLNNINLKISLLAGSTNEEENHKLKEWLNFVLDIPWSTYPIYDINLPISNLEISKLIQNARSTLDIDCYGFSESKEEILRQIINIKIGNSPQVLALCGPPGVGKTMFFSSLGKSLNMPVKFIQCGCINDKSFLSGHSVAYIGAHPGAILSAIKENKNFGCIFVLDEIDKIMDDGIIMNQLIHLLDSSQHNHFIDNYLGSNMPLDISKIYFCCTLNDPNKLSPVLKNRIKILNVNGYTLDEKIQIVKNYALPKIIFKSIFKNHKIIFEDNDIKYFIENKVIGEQGMRNIIISLKELIDKLQLEKMCNYSQKNDNQILTINKKMFPI